jgi:hypothetical protein
VNYAELSTAIQDYTQNTEATFVANIPVFVTQAEERIYNTVQIPPLRKNVKGKCQISNKYVACPADFLSVFSMAIIDGNGNYEYLLNKDVNFLRAAYPNPADSGLPLYYALFGPEVVNKTVTNELSFIVAPTPDDAYEIELHYYYYPESIVTASTSWLGDNYSPSLLYGSLVEAMIFMKGEADMVTYYKEKYTEALSQLNRLGTGLDRGDAYRDGQAKIKVLP